MGKNVEMVVDFDIAAAVVLRWGWRLETLDGFIVKERARSWELTYF